MGSAEMIRGQVRGCLWIPDHDVDEAKKYPFIARRLKLVQEMRLNSKAVSTQSFADRSHRSVQIQGTAKKYSIAVAKVSSERREYISTALFDKNTILSDLLFGIYDAPLWNMALIASKLHLTWIATVCGKLKTDFRYSNTLGWNTFPVPKLTTKNKQDLTRCAEYILLARKSHFPATLAELYDPKKCPKTSATPMTAMMKC